MLWLISSLSRLRLHRSAGDVTQQGKTIQTGRKARQEVSGHGRTEGWTREEEKQDRWAFSPPLCDLIGYWSALTSTRRLFQLSCSPNVSRWRRARFTPTTRKRRRRTTTNPRLKAIGVHARRLTTMTSRCRGSFVFFKFFLKMPCNVSVCDPLTEKRRRHQSRSPFRCRRSWTGSVCPDTSWSAGATCPSSQRRWPAASWG